MIIYQIHKNQNIRAWFIMIAASSLVLVLFSFDTRLGAIVLMLLMASVYGIASTYGYVEGKTSCRLNKIDTGRLIYINVGNKRQPVLLWGVDAPEKDQEGHKMTVKWLSDFIKGKHLSFTDMPEPDYFPGIQKPRYSANTSKLYANGEDIALAGLRAGYLFITQEYVSNELYQAAFGQAEAKGLGIHELREEKPHIRRAKKEADKTGKEKRAIENTQGGAIWLSNQ